jgi:hypothetical protein
MRRTRTPQNAKVIRDLNNLLLTLKADPYKRFTFEGQLYQIDESLLNDDRRTLVSPKNSLEMLGFDN